MGAVLETVCVPGGARGDRVKCLEVMREHGVAIAEGIVRGDAAEEARGRIKPTLDKVAQALEDSEQNLSELAKEDFGLVRAPAIGRGKTNIHFDPYDSEEYRALEALAAEGDFAGLVSSYIGDACTLTEAGASITSVGGEGMEWHRDGTEGEVTVLMSLDDVHEDQGSVGFALGSHRDASLDKETEAEVDEDAVVWYAYRACQPAIFDARVQHRALDNNSDARRYVLWFIYNKEVS